MTGKIQLIEAFAEVARRASFSAAARALNLSPPAVTRLVAELETDLGVQLLVRTTRKVALTTAGEAYLERAVAALAQLRAADDFVRQEQNMLAGRLRVSAPLSFGLRYLATAVSRFRVLYDRINLMLELDDRMVDIVAEDFDMALRISGPPADKSTIWRKIAPVPRLMAASPEYLARQGRPDHPLDLRQHNCLGYSNLAGGMSWVLRHGGKEETVPSSGFCFTCNNGDVLADLAELGEGIVLLPRFIIGERLAEGRLVEVLPAWKSPEIWLTGYYPPYQKLPAKVETFTRFIEDAMGENGKADRRMR